MIYRLLFILLLGGVVSLAQTSPVRVNTTAELVAATIPTTNNKLSAIVAGRASLGDGFGAMFVYDAASVEATNTTTVFKPASTTGRWLAILGPGLTGGGGNVNTSTTNPSGTIPIWGAGNTNLTDTLVSITSKTNLLAGTLTASNLTSGRIIKSLSTGLANSIMSESGQILTLNGGASTIGNDTGNLTIQTGGGNGNVLLLPNGTGKVGIGNASFTPEQLLEIRGGGDVFYKLTTTSGAGDAYQIFYNSGDGTSWAMGRNNAGGFSVTRSTGNFPAGSLSMPLVISASDLIGIGDTTPASLLTVGNGDLFQINSSGNIIRIANIVQTWPLTNSLEGQVFARTAAGQIYYTNAVSSVTTVVSTKTLTDNVATDVFTVALAALARSGLVVDFEIDVTNGTDTQTFTDTRRVSAVNKAGTVTSALSASSSATATSSADTLNVTVAITTTAASFTYTVTADTSLGTPTLTMRYTILNFNNATITLL